MGIASACSIRVDFRTRFYEELCSEIESKLLLCTVKWKKYLKAIAKCSVCSETLQKDDILCSLEKLGVCPEYRGDFLRLRCIVRYILSTKNSIKNFQYLGLLYCDGDIEEKFNYLWWCLGGTADGNKEINYVDVENAAAFLIHIAAILIPQLIGANDKTKVIHLLESLDPRFEIDIACRWLKGVEVGGQISKKALFSWAVDNKEFTSLRARQVALEFAKTYTAKELYIEKENSIQIEKTLPVA